MHEADSRERGASGELAALLADIDRLVSQLDEVSPHDAPAIELIREHAFQLKSLLLSTRTPFIEHRRSGLLEPPLSTSMGLRRGDQGSTFPPARSAL